MSHEIKHPLTGETPSTTAEKMLQVLPLEEAINMAKYYVTNKVEVVPGNVEDPQFWSAVEKYLLDYALLQKDVPKGEWM